MLVGLASIFWVVKSSGFFYIGGLRRNFCFRLGDGPFVVPKRSSQGLPNFGEGKLFWRLSSNAAHREREWVAPGRKIRLPARERGGRGGNSIPTIFMGLVGCARAVFQHYIQNRSRIVEKFLLDKFSRM